MKNKGFIYKIIRIFNMKLGVILQKPLAEGKQEEIRAFIKKHGFILKEKRVLVSAWNIGQHYRQFLGKGFFMDLIKYWTGNEITAWLVLINIEETRKEMGDAKVQVGSFRDFLVGNKWKESLETTGVLDNGIHCSDSASEGLREAKIWFGRMPLSSQTYSSLYTMYLKMVHAYLWWRIGRLGEHFMFAGGTQNGTAITDKPADLDYRIFVQRDKVKAVAEKVTKVVWGSFFDRSGVDSKLDEKYVKFEFNYFGGKADIAVVPVEKYRFKISRAHLMDLLPESMKANIRKRKQLAWRSGGKKPYEAEKAIIRREVERYFNK